MRVRATATLLSAPVHGQAAVLLQDDLALPDPEGLIISVPATAPTYRWVRVVQVAP